MNLANQNFLNYGDGQSSVESLFYTGGAYNRLDNDLSALTCLGPMTVHVVLRPSSNSQNAGVFCKWQNVGSDGNWLIYLGQDVGNNKFAFGVKTGAGSSAFAPSTLTFDANEKFAISGTFDGGSVKCYKNGKFDTSAAATSIDNTSNVIPTLGRLRNSDNTYPYDGYIYLALSWNRSLSQDEIQWVENEPYAFIAPPAPYRKYFALQIGGSLRQQNLTGGMQELIGGLRG